MSSTAHVMPGKAGTRLRGKRLHLQRGEGHAFLFRDSMQGSVARQVVGPVASAAAASLFPKCPLKHRDELFAALKGAVSNFLRPER
jgi:hypothetical protein